VRRFAVTKKEIVKRISEELKIPQLTVKDIVQRTFDSVIDALSTEGRIELRNFGVFKVTTRAPRMARNPKTGDRVPVPQKKVVCFKPGKEMEDKIH
jgi:integration host factor subunit beta